MSPITSSPVIFGSAADAIDIVKDHNTVTAANTARQGHHHSQFPRPPVLP
jgi:hypothetical protein